MNARRNRQHRGQAGAWGGRSTVVILATGLVFSAASVGWAASFDKGSGRDENSFEVTPRAPFVVKDAEAVYSTGRVLVKVRPIRNAKSTGQIVLPGVTSVTPLNTAPGSPTTAAAAQPEWLVAELDGSLGIDEALATLSVDDQVIEVQPDYSRAIPVPRQSWGTVTATAANDPRTSEQWALDAMQLHQAWGMASGSKSVVVAVVDSGVDIDHPDLVDQFWRNPNEELNGYDDDGNGFVDDIIGWDFVNRDNNPDDDNEHGTHVSGIVAATRNNGVGVAGTANVSIMALKALDYQGSGADSDILGAIEYAIANGADIINLSLGGGPYNSAYDDICRRAAAANVLVVAASGNQYASEVSFPASLSTVMAVGAVDSYDQVADFSNTGQGLDVVAPGVSVLSTVPGGDYSAFDGTSMASPYVAGLAALLRSANPQMGVDSLRSRIAGSADDLGDPGYDVYAGYGRVNAYRAMSGDGHDVAPPETDPGNGGGTGTDDTYEPNDSASEARRLTSGEYRLQGWDDDWFEFQPGGRGSISVQVDGSQGDLDLYVFDANGYIVDNSQAYGSQEQVSITSDGQRLIVLVAPYQGQGGSYTLTIDDPNARPDHDPYYPTPINGGPVGCGAGAVQAMVVGLCSLIGFAGTSLRRRRRASSDYLNLSEFEEE